MSFCFEGLLEERIRYYTTLTILIEGQETIKTVKTWYVKYNLLKAQNKYLCIGSTLICKHSVSGFCLFMGH